jgi:hypothetical protein
VSLNLNATEKEVSLLLAARKLIQGMVNRSMLSLSDNYEELWVRPETSQSAALFNILLVDFISPLGVPFSSSVTMLSGLLEITNSPHFDKDNSIQQLKDSLNEFNSWLDYKATFDKIRIPSIDRELSLTLDRKEFVTICGTIAKHNTFRLTGVSKKILGILQRSDPSITLENAFSAIEDFYERFHQDVFYYHLSKLSEMLNNISWGIQTYLEPEYKRSYTVDKKKSEMLKIVFYSFDYPAEIMSELGKIYYWDLMNELRARPYIPKFSAPSLQLQRY